MYRRDFLRAGVLVVGAEALRGGGFAHRSALSSFTEKVAAPQLQTYTDPLPIPPVIRPKIGEIIDIRLQRGLAQIHRDLPPATIWGYNGIWPGPTIEVRRGRQVHVHWTNELPGKHLLPIDHTIHGAGTKVPDVRTVTHLHGARVMPEDDGYPEAWIAPDGTTGPQYNPHPFFYPNEQEAATLWYHDHALGITRLNIYSGLAGFYLIRDEEEDQLRLPAGKYEIPLMLQDRSVNPDGSLHYPVAENGTHPVWVQQFFGDINCVNGKAWPFLEVEPRKYRFRILNASNSRVYQLLLEPSEPRGKPLNAPGPAMHVIGTDSGLLPAPVEVSPLTIAPGERYDVVIDFAGQMGRNFVFINGGAAPFAFGGETTPPEVLLFRVDQPLAGEDRSQLPAKLTQRPSLLKGGATAERKLTVNERVRSSDQYTIIGLLGENRWSDPVTEDPKMNSTEIWSFMNTTEEAHPIHIHLAHFEVMHRREFNSPFYKKTGQIVFEGEFEPPALEEQGALKDTVIAYPEYITTVMARFQLPSAATASLAKGFRYVWHCHILEHEDNEMMRPYDVVR